MRKLILLAMVFLSSLGWGQGFFQLTPPIPGAVVRVCPVGTANPCPSPSSIFSDSGLSVPVANPFNVGPTGQFGFWAAAGQFLIQISGPVTQSFVITMGGGGSLPAGLSFVVPTLTVSTAGSGNGVLALSGNTSGTATFTAPAVAGTTTNPISISNVLQAANGAAATPSYSFPGAPTAGIYSCGSIAGLCFSAVGVSAATITNEGAQARFGLAGNWMLAWTNGTNNADTASGNYDTGLSRISAGVVGVGNGTASSVAGTIEPGKYATGTNCSSSASPAVCGSAAAGSVAVPTGTNATLQVNTTAVTANSQIFVQSDDTLGTKLGITCNSTLASLIVEPVVSARSGGSSFTITISGTTTTNPVCLSYFIIN